MCGPGEANTPHVGSPFPRKLPYKYHKQTKIVRIVVILLYVNPQKQTAPTEVPNQGLMYLGFFFFFLRVHFVKSKSYFCEMY